RGEELPRFGLEDQWQAEAILEEAPLFGERPGEEDLAERVRRGGGVVVRRVEAGGEDIAATAAADEDLATPIAGAFEEQDPSALLRGEARRHQTGSPGPGHHDQRCVGAHRLPDRK